MKREYPKIPRKERMSQNPKKRMRIILNHSDRRQILGLLWEGDVIPERGRAWSGWQGFHSYTINSSWILNYFINFRVRYPAVSLILVRVTWIYARKRLKN